MFTEIYSSNEVGFDCVGCWTTNPFKFITFIALVEELSEKPQLHLFKGNLIVAHYFDTATWTKERSWVNDHLTLLYYNNHPCSCNLSVLCHTDQRDEINPYSSQVRSILKKQIDDYNAREKTIGVQRKVLRNSSSNICVHVTFLLLWMIALPEVLGLGTYF